MKVYFNNTMQKGGGMNFNFLPYFSLFWIKTEYFYINIGWFNVGLTIQIK